MGSHTHHAIVVTCWNIHHVNIAREKATELGLTVTPLAPNTMNGWTTFCIVPDGGKDGWEESDKGDSLRATFKAWIRAEEATPSHEGANWCEWIEVSFSRDHGIATVIDSNSGGGEHKPFDEPTNGVTPPSAPESTDAPTIKAAPWMCRAAQGACMAVATKGDFWCSLGCYGAHRTAPRMHVTPEPGSGTWVAHTVKVSEAKGYVQYQDLPGEVGDTAPEPAMGDEIEAAMWRYRDAAISVGANGDGHGSMAEYGECLRALIARRVAEAERERDEALAERDELAGEQAHPESLRGQWAKLRAERERMTKERDEARAEVERLKAGGCSGDFKSVAEAMLARWRERRARCLNGVAPTLAEIQAAMPSWTTEVVVQKSAPNGSAMRRTIDSANHIIDMLWKHSETLRERFDYEMEQRDELHAALVKTTDERDEARAELARLRAGGCARDQTTTQWCAEAVALQREVDRLRDELAAKGGDHGK